MSFSSSVSEVGLAIGSFANPIFGSEKITTTTGGDTPDSSTKNTTAIVVIVVVVLLGVAGYLLFNKKTPVPVS